MGEFCRAKPAIEPICITSAVNRYDNIVILWNHSQKKRVLGHDFFYVARASGSSAQGIRAKSVISGSTLNIRELHLNIRSGVIGSYHCCFLTFPVFHVSQSFFC